MDGLPTAEIWPAPRALDADRLCHPFRPFAPGGMRARDGLALLASTRRSALPPLARTSGGPRAEGTVVCPFQAGPWVPWRSRLRAGTSIVRL